MNDFKTVRIDRDGPVAVVTLNRPDSLNSFNGELRREFLAAVQAVNADPAIRVAVLTGEGRAFCAGAEPKKARTEGRAAAESSAACAALACAVEKSLLHAFLSRFFGKHAEDEVLI